MKTKKITICTKFTDKQGNEKKVWTDIGMLFTNDKGQQSIRMALIPVNWDGHAFIFDIVKKEKTNE